MIRRYTSGAWFRFEGSGFLAGSKLPRKKWVRAVLAARAIIDRDVKIEHARIAHSERLCGRRRPRTQNHHGHQCPSAKGRRIISLREQQKELPWNHILTQNL